MSESSSRYVKYISIPKKLPTISCRYKQCGGSNKNRPLLIKYSTGIELNLNDIISLKNNIINTKEKYVHPMAFVNFARGYICNDDIIFDKHKLFKLRIWSNQLRELFQNRNYNDADYLAYIIGCKIIKYAKNNNEN